MREGKRADKPAMIAAALLHVMPSHSFSKESQSVCILDHV